MPIEQNQGLTESERYLARLCEHTFLKVWSYPNLYTDEGRKGGKGQGKELCDLLVVFGEHILIFSDKNISFKDTGDLNVDWGRWVKRAVLKSAKQVYGAEKWVRENPDRIFLDKFCRNKFPINFPDLDKAIFHRIVVASNATKEFRKYVGGSGSLFIRPEVIGEEHFKNPFTLGQIDPQRGYIHVFDEVALDVVMRERDTIADFITYLSKKEKFIASGKLMLAAGEEELLGFYLGNLNEENQHDFVLEDSASLACLNEGIWNNIQALPQYRFSKEENLVSYDWDALIDIFGRHALDGSFEDASSSDFNDQIAGLKVMAGEDRCSRRLLAGSFREKFLATKTDKKGVRAILSPSQKNVGYLFLFYPRSDGERSYGQYRQDRRALLLGYCDAMKAKFPDLEKIIGLACEPKGSNGGSEDMIYSDTSEWTAKQLEETERFRQECGLLLDDRVVENKGTEYEFPLPPKDESLGGPKYKKAASSSKIKLKNQKKKKRKKKLTKNSRKKNRRK